MFYLSCWSNTLDSAQSYLWQNKGGLASWGKPQPAGCPHTYLPPSHCISKPHLANLFLNCISQQYLANVFLNCISHQENHNLLAVLVHLLIPRKPSAPFLLETCKLQGLTFLSFFGAFLNTSKTLNHNNHTWYFGSHIFERTFRTNDDDDDGWCIIGCVVIVVVFLLFLLLLVLVVGGWCLFNQRILFTIFIISCVVTVYKYSRAQFALG